MLFQQIILQLVDRFNEERTISASFHMLKGKRSGQTIQDVRNYGMTQYFSLFPNLSKQLYDQTIHEMIELEWLKVNDLSIPHVTKMGHQKLDNIPTLQLNGWLYRGNERIFFSRLSLVTQTLSHIHSNDFSFIPFQKDEKIQLWVRNFLQAHPYKSREFIQMYDAELRKVFQAQKLEEVHRLILSHRFSGFEVSGLTWKQLSHTLKIEQMDLQVLFQECLHILLDEISMNPSCILLNKITEGVITTCALTESAKKTAEFYQNGHSFDQIMTIRQLKSSTIEDHFVEMAMSGHLKAVQQFFPHKDIGVLSQQMKNQQTKKLKTLKTIYPMYSYFQLRLLLALGGD